MIAKWCYLRKAMKNEVVNQKKVMTNDLIQNENLKKITILKLSIDSFNVQKLKPKNNIRQYMMQDGKFNLYRKNYI